MATLNGAISSTAELIRVTGTAPEPGAYFTVDSEAIRFLGTSRGATGRAFTRGYWSVDRGVAGTTKATHSNGATLTRYYPDSASAGGGGGGVTVTDGDVDVTATSITQPTGTVKQLSAGIAQILPVVISESDPGAIGAGNLWLVGSGAGDPVQLRVRDESDVDWIDITLRLDTTAGDQTVFSPDGTNSFNVSDSGMAVEIDARDSEGFGSNNIILSVHNDDRVFADIVKLDSTGVTVGNTGAAVGFFGGTPAAQPQVPASPDAQDIVDALVALGLISQAS